MHQVMVTPPPARLHPPLPPRVFPPRPCPPPGGRRDSKIPQTKRGGQPTQLKGSPTRGGSSEQSPGEDAEVALPPPPRPVGPGPSPGNHTPTTHERTAHPSANESVGTKHCQTCPGHREEKPADEVYGHPKLIFFKGGRGSLKAPHPLNRPSMPN